MRSYHFSCGDSAQGPVGLCARVSANSKEGALRKLRRALSDHSGGAGEVKIVVASLDIEYVEFYVSPSNISLADIDGD
jgi:hypothetical protein